MYCSQMCCKFIGSCERDALSLAEATWKWALECLSRAVLLGDVTFKLISSAKWTRLCAANMLAAEAPLVDFPSRLCTCAMKAD